jgi:sortase A
VDATEIVEPQTVGVLAAGGRSDLTLVTCYPFRFAGPAPERFAVKARLVSQSSPHGSPPW